MNHHRLAALGFAALTLTTLLSLAGCASTSQGQTQSSPTRSTPQASPTATATPAPTVPPPAIPLVQSISLGSYKTDLALPGAAGLALDPNVPSSSAGMPSIAFYSYATHSVQQIATAPTESDGSVGGILGSQYGGDWVSYVTEDNSQREWVLWVYNVKTGARVQVDSEAREQITAPFSPGSWVTTDTDLIWSVVTIANSQFNSKVLDYSYSSQQT